MAKTLGMVFGVIFVLVGLLGFINNPIVGMDGFFQTDTIHNLVHLIIGIVLILAARKSEVASVKALRIVGIVYLLLAVVGFVMGEGELLGLVLMNTADHWLHLVLGVVLLAAAMFAGKKGSTPMSSAPMGGQM